jgi:hypothetical protein
LTRAREALVEAMRPAPASATMAHVEFLRSRYRARPAEPAHLADADARLWIEALAHWPADIAEAACYRWMTADKPFPPSVPGELLPFGDPILARRRAWLWRVERMIEALSRGGADAPEAEHSFGRRSLRDLAGQVRRALAPVCGMSTRLASRPERSQRRGLALAALHVRPASSLEAQQKPSPALAGDGWVGATPEGRWKHACSSGGVSCVSSGEPPPQPSPASAGEGVLRVHPTFEISGGAA